MDKIHYNCDDNGYFNKDEVIKFIKDFIDVQKKLLLIKVINNTDLDLN
jgi:hypothetical protein